LTIAAETKTPVLFVAEELPVEVSVPLTADAPYVAQMKTAPVMAYQSTGTEVQLAEVVTPPPPAQMVASLPTTAGILPLLEMLSFLTLCGGLAVRRIRSTNS